MTNPQHIPDNSSLEPTVRALQHLSPQGQEMAVSLVRQLAEREGISVEAAAYIGLQSPIEGIPLWTAKLRAERYSPRTVHMYQYLAVRYLKLNPTPTKLEIQSYLASRLEDVSPALVSNERKALASLFSFLHGEGLWPVNPLNAVGHVRVRYRERLSPDIGDVLRVLESTCLRKKDGDKLRVLVLLLATTGIRITEAASLLKDSVNMETLELRVVGKGDKVRAVPLLPQTAEALRDYMKRRRSQSPYVFPGDTATGHMNIHNLEKTLRRMCVRLGLRPFTPHQLRHLYATHMLRGGAKLEVVSRILGHTGVGVTADIYRHVAMAEVHEEHLRFAPLNGKKTLLEGKGGGADGSEA
jgi:integrase/recombinase XerD